VYVGPEGVLTGSMRAAQEARESAAAIALQEEIAAKRREVERLQATLERQTQNRADTAVRRGGDSARTKGKKPA
jgi:hypothetical protein